MICHSYTSLQLNDHIMIFWTKKNQIMTHFEIEVNKIVRLLLVNFNRKSMRWHHMLVLDKGFLNLRSARLCRMVILRPF
jgi:hypothetical protein